MSNNHLLSIERAYAEGDPLDMDDAREASRTSSRMRRAAEAELRQRVEEVGKAEGAYRELLAKEIVAAKADHGATAALDIAKGDAKVVKALIDFRVASGMVDAAKERLKTIEGDRSQLRGLIDFSAGVRAVLHEQREDERPGHLRSAA